MPTNADWNTGSGNWFSAANWDEVNPGPGPTPIHYVPGMDNDVNIFGNLPAGTAFSVAYNGTGTVNSLTSSAVATLDITGGSLTTLNGGGGFGTMNLSSGATFSVTAGTFSLNSGSLSGTLAGAGTLRFVNGVFQINSGVDITVDTWLLTYQIGSGTVSRTNINADLTYAKDFQLLDVFGNFPILNLNGNTLTLSGTSIIDGNIEEAGVLRITGTGTVRDAGVHDGAKLQISGSTTQTGTLQLDGTFQIDAGASHTFTAPSQVTVAGGGTGVSVNNGTLAATGSGTSRIDGGFTNNGTVTIGANAEITFNTGTQNLKGTIAGAGQLGFGFAHNATLDTSSLTVGSIYINGGNGGGTLSLGRSLSYANSFTFQDQFGTLDLNGFTMTLSGTSVLAGGGSIDGGGKLRITGSSTLTFVTIGDKAGGGGSAATLQNSGSILQNDYVYLRGTILNDAGHSYTLAAARIENLAGGAIVTNNGTLNVITRSPLTESAIDAVFTNTGTLSVGTSALLTIRGTSTIGGTVVGNGTLTLAGTSTVNTSITTAALNFNGNTTLGVNLTYNGKFSLGVFNTINLDSHTLTLAGVSNLNNGFAAINGPGTVSITGASTIGGISMGSLSGAMTLKNSGTIEQVGGISLNGTIQNLADHTYKLEATSVTPNGSATFSNSGILAVLKTGSASNSEINAAFTNSGTLTVANGALLRLSGTNTLGGTVNGSGALQLAGTSTVNTGISTAALSFLGTTSLGVNLNYANDFNIGVFSTTNLNGHTLTLGGTSHFDTGFNSVNGGGTLKITGSAIVNGVSIGSPGGLVTFQNSGAVEQLGSISLRGTLLNDAGRVYTLAAGDIHDSSAIVTNNGTFEKSGLAGSSTVSATFTNNGLVVVDDGTLILQNLTNIGVIEGVISQSGAQATITADLAGQVTLTGGSGNNTLNGQSGVATMSGGTGNDTYVVDSSTDKVFEAAGAGADTIVSTVNYTLAAGQEIESLRLAISTGSAALNLKGNEFVNELLGNAGANVLTGGAGNDIMRGGNGDDTYVVTETGDQVFEAVGGGTDTVVSTVSFTLAAGQEIEILRLASPTGSAALNLKGNEFVNELLGNAGVNLLTGGGGNDLLRGGGGNDTYAVSDSGDQVFESVGGGADTIVSTVSYTIAANQEIEVLRLAGSTGSTALNLTGNAFVNQLLGNAGANTLNGARGNDFLTGGGGNDTYYFNTTLDGANNADRIFGFANAAGNNDTIALKSTIFSMLGAGLLNAANFVANATGTAGDANDFIVYNTTTGGLFYDSNGSGSGGGILFATLDAHPGLTAADFIIV